MFRYTDFNCRTVHEDGTRCPGHRMVMHDKDDRPKSEICRICGADMLPGFPAPAVMRASFAEGQERGERWTMLKQSAKMEQDASRARKNKKMDEYKELKTEATKLNQRAKSKRDKTDI